MECRVWDMSVAGETDVAESMVLQSSRLSWCCCSRSNERTWWFKVTGLESPGVSDHTHRPSQTWSPAGTPSCSVTEAGIVRFAGLVESF